MEALLSLQVRTGLMLDLGERDNVVQARHELDRAIEQGNHADRSAWCIRWGRSALDIADDRQGEVGMLEDQLEEAEREAKDAAIVDTGDLDAELEDAKTYIAEAVVCLAELPTSAGSPADLSEKLEMAADAVANAIKEASKL